MRLVTLTDQQLRQTTIKAIQDRDNHLIGLCADESDRRDRHTPPAPTVATTLAEAAQWYAAQGLSVFPLQPWSKIPIAGSHGCKDATTNPAQIGHWWMRTSDANIGIATGLAIDVADLDGWAGVDTWAGLEGVPPTLGVVVTPRTEGGGRHVYLPVTGQGNRARMLPGVDYRGAGGYVVAPPSVLPEGRYWWLRPLRMPADAA